MTTLNTQMLNRTLVIKRNQEADNERDKAWRSAVYELGQGAPLVSVLGRLRLRYFEIHNQACGL